MSMREVTEEMLEWCLPSFAIDCVMEKFCKTMEKNIKTGVFTGSVRLFPILVDEKEFAHSVVMSCSKFLFNPWSKVMFVGQKLRFYSDKDVMILCVPGFGFNPLPNGRLEATREELEAWK